MQPFDVSLLLGTFALLTGMVGWTVRLLMRLTEAVGRLEAEVAALGHRVGALEAHLQRTAAMPPRNTGSDVTWVPQRDRV